MWTDDVSRLSDLDARRFIPALMRNPSLPLDLLGECLRGGNVDAWHNPSVPLLVLREPLEVYREAGRQALARKTKSTQLWLKSEMPFDSLVRMWGGYQRVMGLAPERNAYDFARHLATLFSLPWPEDR